MLRRSCERFDHNEPLEAKEIALRLRILWHNTSRSFGLASQLKLANEIVDTAFVVPPTFINPESSEPPPDERRLFAIGGSRHYAPLFDYGPEGVHKSPFKQWWEGTVLSDGEGHKFTRKDLVRNVADTDGGAHVDPKLDSIYYNLTRKGTFGVIRVVPTGVPNQFRKVETPSPVAVTLRQIGHETLKSLYPGYNYDGRPFYPGPAICWMTAVITPTTKPDSTKE